MPTLTARIEQPSLHRTSPGGTRGRIAAYGITSVVLLSLSVSQLHAQEGTGTKPKTGSPEARAQQTSIQTEAAFILHRDRTKARQGFQNAIEIDSRYAPAWFNLGVLAEGDKEWTKAVGDFKRYCRLDLIALPFRLWTRIDYLGGRRCERHHRCRRPGPYHCRRGLRPRESRRCPRRTDQGAQKDRKEGPQWVPHHRLRCHHL